MRCKHSPLIGVEGGDSWGMSGTGETPQWSVSDRGGSPPAPRKASAWNANQQIFLVGLIKNKKTTFPEIKLSQKWFFVVWV